jgi:hypothetical protein
MQTTQSDNEGCRWEKTRTPCSCQVQSYSSRHTQAKLKYREFALSLKLNQPKVEAITLQNFKPKVISCRRDMGQLDEI